MKKQCTKVFSALAVLAMLGGSLVSCGEKKVTNFGGVEAKYFYSYFTQPVDGQDDLATTSGMTLLESGTEGVKAHAYKAPENYKISWEVLDDAGNETSDVKIAEDGSVTLPSVSGSGAAARKDYTVYCIASDPADSEKNVRYKSTLTVVPKGSIKTGKQDLQGLTTEDTQPLMGQVEALGLETGMTGMNFWAYGGYQKIASRVYNSRSENGKFTSSTYVPGFGFGHSIYSYLTEDNPKETNASWKRYFHTDNSTIPDNVNYYLASGTGVTDYYGYAVSSYFPKLLNDSDADVYTPGLAAVAEPIPCDDDGNELSGDAAKGFHSTWKVYMNTGSTENKVTYRNLGTKNGSAYDKKGVELEDYITPFVMQYTQWVGCANVTQLLSGSSALKGAADYYQATKEDPGEGKRKVSVAEFLEKVPGIKLNKEENSITFVLETGCTSDYAAYYLGGNSPIPMDFVTDVLGKGDLKAGMTKYGTKDESDGSNPEDNFLSTGPLILEKLDENRVVYKRNEDWWVKKDPAGRDIYKMEGFVYNYNSALKQDSSGETLYNSYVAGYTETSGLPSAKINDLKNDPDTVHIENTGDKNGVSFNALNKVDYDYLFGTGDEFEAHAIAGQFYGDFGLGSAGNKDYRASYFEDDWEVKPIMSNHNFIKGLNTGYDRDTFAETKGRKGFSDYFGDVNKMSPKAEQRYNDTDDHINAVKSVYGEQGIPTDSSAVALGVQYFKAALQEELEAGHYVLGTEDAPTEIHVNVNWQSQVWTDYQGTAIFNAISDTFSSAVSSNASWVGENKKPLIKLVFDQTYEGSGSADYMNAYAKVALGQYDIAQASISGGEYDVFIETGLWESYNRDYSLTIHHALVTNIPSSYLYFDGGYWSTDALYYGNTQGVTLNDAGRIVYDDLKPIE